MSNQDEWGPWIEHDQSSVPAEVLGQYIEVESLHPNGAKDVDQFWHPSDLDHDWRFVWSVGHISERDGLLLVAILRYRIRKPRGMAVLDAIMTDTNTPIKEDAQ